MGLGVFSSASLQNVRYGLRVIRRNPGFAVGCDFDFGVGHRREHGDFFHCECDFSAAAAISGIGPDVFGCAHKQSKSAARIYRWPLFLAWKEKQGLFDALGTVNGPVNFTLTGHGDPEQIPTDIITYGVLPVLERKSGDRKGISAGRGASWCAYRSGNQRRFVAPEIFRRSKHCWPDNFARRRATNCGRSDASGVSDSTSVCGKCANLVAGETAFVEPKPKQLTCVVSRG